MSGRVTDNPEPEQEQWMGDRDDGAALIKLLAAQSARLQQALEALRDIADDACCETPGCNVDDPKCTTMHARAALSRIGAET